MSALLETPERARLSLDIDTRAKEQIEALKKRVGTSSTTEVVRKALILYDVITQHTSEGGEVLFRDRDGVIEKLVLL